MERCNFILFLMLFGMLLISFLLWIYDPRLRRRLIDCFFCCCCCCCCFSPSSATRAADARQHLLRIRLRDPGMKIHRHPPSIAFARSPQQLAKLRSDNHAILIQEGKIVGCTCVTKL